MSTFSRRLTVSMQWAAVGTMSIVLSFFALVPIDAEAKRMGGGSSFGRQAPAQRQAPPTKPAQQPSQQPAQQPGQQPAAAPAGAPAAAQTAAPARNTWMGPVAGLAAGLGLAALASYLGFGEELMSMLLIVAGVLLAVFLLRLVMSRGRQAQPAAAGATAGASGAPMPRASLEDAQLRDSMAQPASNSVGQAEQPLALQTSEVEVERFLTVAREQFLHLQKVWDEGRLDDIRGFTTESMAEGLRQQLFQRGPSANVTTVDELHVEWFGQSRDSGEDGQPVDAVFIRFHGLIREAVDALPTHFDETWTLHKTIGDPNAGWLLAGITQNAQT